MKNAIKIISLLLAVVLLFSGCSIDLGKAVTFFTGKSLSEIEGIDFSDGLLDARFFDRFLVMLVCKPVFEEEPEYRFYKVDAKKSKVVAVTKLIGCPIKNPYGLDVDENGNCLLFGTEDYEHEEIVCVPISVDTLTVSGEMTAYNCALPSIDSEENDFGFIFGEGEQIATYETDDIPNNPIFAYSFRDSQDKVVFANSLDFGNYGSYNKLVAGKAFQTPGVESDEETLVVYDFENALLVNEITFPTLTEDGKSKYITSIYLSDKYAMLTEETADYDEENYETRCLIWKYRKNALNEPYETTVRTLDEIKKHNERIIEQVKINYGINISVNDKKFDYYKKGEDYYLSNNAKTFDVHILLLKIKAFLDMLPEGFAKEIYSDMDIFEYSGFDIFIGDSIEGIANAYAMTYMDRMTIVFSTGAIDFRTVAHEFMHTIDTRIEDKLGLDESFYDLWLEYNPDDFEYTGLQNENGDYDYEKYDDYFVSTYAASTDCEDRAEIFSFLFSESLEDDGPPDWYVEKEPLRKKTDFLLKMIREAYPSLKNVKVAQWEKPLEKDKTE